MSGNGQGVSGPGIKDGILESAMPGAPEALIRALQDQLKAIVEKPLTAKTLKELEQTALLSRQMLIVSGAPGAMKNQRRRGIGLGMADDFDIVGGDGMDDGSFMGAENFGAAAIRELVAQKNKPSLVRQVEALATAKDAGFTKIAEKLERDILEEIEPAKVELGVDPLSAEEHELLDQVEREGVEREGVGVVGGVSLLEEETASPTGIERLDVEVSDTMDGEEEE